MAQAPTWQQAAVPAARRAEASAWSFAVITAGNAIGGVIIQNANTAAASAGALSLTGAPSVAWRRSMMAGCGSAGRHQRPKGWYRSGRDQSTPGRLDLPLLTRPDFTGTGMDPADLGRDASHGVRVPVTEGG